MQRKKVLSVCAVFTAGLATSHVLAAELQWKGGDGAIISANYTTTGTDTVTPAADNLDIGTGATVAYSAAGNNNNVSRGRIGHNFAPFGSGNPSLAGSATLNVNGTGSLTFGGSGFGTGLTPGIVIGYNADGTANVSSGSLGAGTGVIVGYNSNDASGAAGTGTVNVSGGFFRSVNADMRVGSGNPGVVKVSGTGTLAVIPTNLGQAAVPDLVFGFSTPSTFTQTGGTTTVANTFFIGAGSSATISGGTVTTKAKTTAAGFTNTPAPDGNLVVGRNGSAGDKLEVSQTALLNIGNRLLTGSGGAGATGVVVNQKGGTINVALNASIADTGGDSTYNLSGGTLNANSTLSRVGRQGSGTFIETGGFANFNGGLAVGENNGVAGAASGVYEISAGEVHATAAVDALLIGTAGAGTFRVVGDDGTVDVNGNLTVGNTAAGQGNLAYKSEAGDSVFSVIDVSGVATFNAGSALSLDFAGIDPGATTSFDLLTAPTITDNGLTFSGPAGWSYRIVSGGVEGQLLQAFVPEPSTLGLIAATAGLLCSRRRRA